MRKFDVNKLVRDHSYEQMAQECAQMVIEPLNLDNFQRALKLKLLEEAHEVIAEEHTTGLTEEIADVLEVIDGLIQAYGLNRADIEKVKEKKKQVKGGFSQAKRCVYLLANQHDSRHHDLIDYCVKRPAKYPETTTVLHRTPPHDFNFQLDVSACYVMYQDQILLLKRMHDKSEGNQWGVPAGKLDQGENALATAIRELYEETGIQCSENKLSFIADVYARRPHLYFVYHMYTAILKEKPNVVLSPNEHSEYQWLCLEEAKKLPLMGGALESILIFEDYLKRTKVA